LHAKGSFYIPLTIDSEILAPYLAAVGFDINGLPVDDPESTVLHPVTISVNFQQTNHHRILQNHHSRQNNNNSSAWKNEANSFVPVSRWSVYLPDRN
jgi:hypothetical protein